MKNYAVLALLFASHQAASNTLTYKLDTSKATSSNTSCEANSNIYYSSLEEIHNCLTGMSLHNTAVDIIVSGNSNKISDSPLLWQVSGSSGYPITIKSESESTRAKLVAEKNEAYKVEFKDVSYIHIDNIEVTNSSVGFKLNNVNNSKVTRSVFVGNTIQGSGGAAMLWIGSETGSGKHARFNNSYSQNNLIERNSFFGVKVKNFCQQHMYHNVYVSWGNKNNIIRSNSFGIRTSGSGVAFNHGYQVGNLVRDNYFDIVYAEAQSWQVKEGCGSALETQENGWSKVVDSGGAIGLRMEPGKDNPSTIYGNDIAINTIKKNVNISIEQENCCSANGFIDVQFSPELISTNRVFEIPFD